MAWTTPDTYVVGQLLTAATMNRIRDNMKEVWREIAYVEFTADVATSATTAATAVTVVSAGAITFDGSLAIVEFYAENIRAASAAGQTECFLNLWMDGTDLGQIGEVGNYTGGAGAAPSHQTCAQRRLTPSAASHTFIVKAWEAGGTATVKAGAGGAGVAMPGYIRILQKGG